MTRVPTYMSNMNMVSNALKLKADVDKYSYQATTGLKAQNYSGYGISAYNIVSMEASSSLVNTFMENNKILSAELEMMNTSLETISNAIANFKTTITEFYSVAKSNITPDYTGGAIYFNNNNVSAYHDKTLTINGVQYTFKTSGAASATDIDISSAYTAQDIIDALMNKLPANSGCTADGTLLSFPLYTVNGTSSVLQLDGISTNPAHTMAPDQESTYVQLQASAFATLQLIADALNINLDGKYLFGGGASTEPVKFAFSSLEEFQSYYDGINISYPMHTNASLSNRTVSGINTGDIVFGPADGNQVQISATSGSFDTKVLDGGEDVTGDITFDADTQSIRATKYGAFNTLKAGDTINVYNQNTGRYQQFVIDEVSKDGKTIKTQGGITTTTTITNGQGIGFSTTFAKGTVISFDGLSGLPEGAQVLQVSPDGKTMTVSMNTSLYSAGGTTVSGDKPWSINSVSYYTGSAGSTNKMISENQSISFDINASDSVFAKIMTALGTLAQGNLVDTRNPADNLSSKIDPNEIVKICEEALNNIISASSSHTSGTQAKNSDLSTVMLKVTTNMLTISNVTKNQELIQNNLTESIASLKQVDKAEASTMLLMAQSSLSASYSVLSSALDLSLLNYLK